MKNLFFGWTNFKWLCRELMAMYSNSNSYFSKKRFESSVAFVTAMAIIVAHVVHDRNNITNSEILADATLLFVIAGYTVNQIQKEKGSDSVVKKASLPSEKIKDNNQAKDNNLEKNTENFSKDEDAV